MDELLKLLDQKLKYIRHDIIDNTIFIYAESEEIEVCCPYCGRLSKRVHSIYQRSFQDMPIQGKKVITVLNNRKMFCDNTNCSHTTFAQTYVFLPYKAKKTKRLTDAIYDISLNCSSVSASKILRSSFADVSKSTICNLLKKRSSNN
jgi:hypothetical protein